MCSVSKERRAQWIDGIGQWLYYGVPIGDTCDLPSAEELLYIVKALDERDRYRALLGDVLEDNGHAGYTTPETLNRIDAAPEGKTND